MNNGLDQAETGAGWVSTANQQRFAERLRRAATDTQEPRESPVKARRVIKRVVAPFADAIVEADEVVMDESLGTALDVLDAGLTPVPARLSNKRLSDLPWLAPGSRRPPQSDVAQWFSGTGQVEVMCGGQWGGLAGIVIGVKHVVNENKTFAPIIEAMQRAGLENEWSTLWNGWRRRDGTMWRLLWICETTPPSHTLVHFTGEVSGKTLYRVDLYGDGERLRVDQRANRSFDDVERASTWTRSAWSISRAHLHAPPRISPEVRDRILEVLCDVVPDGDPSDPPRAEQARRHREPLRPSELAKIKPLEWTVAGLVPKGSLTSLIGPPKAGKTFVAIDLAVAVGTGQPFCDRKVSRGRVLYIGGESQAGLNERQHAACLHRDVEITEIDQQLLWHHGTFNLLNGPETESLLLLAARVRPDLIILDPLARFMVGGDENSVRDISRAVDVLDRLRSLGCTVLLLHHTGRSGSQGRGSSALDAAVDAELDLSRRGGLLTLSNRYQRDGPVAEDIQLRLEPVGLSCALLLRAADSDAAAVEPPAIHMQRVSAVLEAGGEPRTISQLRKEVTGRSNLIDAAIGALLVEGFIADLNPDGGQRAFVSLQPYRPPMSA